MTYIQQVPPRQLSKIACEWGSLITFLSYLAEKFIQLSLVLSVSPVCRYTAAIWTQNATIQRILWCIRGYRVKSMDRAPVRRREINRRHTNVMLVFWNCYSDIVRIPTARHQRSLNWVFDKYCRCCSEGRYCFSFSYVWLEIWFLETDKVHSFIYRQLENLKSWSKTDVSVQLKN